MKVKIRHRRRADDDHAADHEEHEDVGRAWTPAAAAAAAAPAAGAALNRRQAREAAGRANRDAELEGGLDDEDGEEHDELPTTVTLKDRKTRGTRRGRILPPRP